MFSTNWSEDSMAPLICSTGNIFESSSQSLLLGSSFVLDIGVYVLNAFVVYKVYCTSAD